MAGINNPRFRYDCEAPATQAQPSGLTRLTWKVNMAAILIHKEISLLFSSDPLVGAEGVSADGSSYSTTLDTPFVIPASAMSCSAGVIAASIWNSSPNVSAAFSNNTLSFVTTVAPAGAYTIPIEQGLYSLDALGSYISIELQNRGLPPDLIQFSPNNATQRVGITLSTAGDSVLIGAAGSVGQILGWPTGSPAIVAPVAGFTQFGPLEASLNRVNSYIIQSDFVTTGVQLNGSSRSILASVPINVGPGRQINFQPSQVQFFDASELIGRPKQFVRLSLVDQDLRPTPTSGDTWSVTLLVKYSILLSSMAVPLRSV